MYCTSIEETALGASVVIMIRKTFRSWKAVVGFRKMCKLVFGWGRKRMLKIIWNTLLKNWRTLKTRRCIAFEEGSCYLKNRMFLKWAKFTRKMIKGKVKFVKRLFRRRVEYIVRAWRVYAVKKGLKKKIADSLFYKNGTARGYEAWRMHFLVTSRLKAKGKVVRIKNEKKR